MGEESDDAPTAYAPTELGAMVEDSTAWSLVEYEPEPRPQWIVAAAVGAAVVALAVAGALAWVHLRPAPEVVAVPSPSTTVNSTPDAVPTPSLAATPPPLPPSTVTVTAPPPVTQTVAAPTPQVIGPPVAGPAPAYIAEISAFDDRFLAMLRQRNWAIWDPPLMVSRGHSTCSMLRAGEPRWLIQQKLIGVEPQLTQSMAAQFTEVVSAAYPGCP